MSKKRNLFAGLICLVLAFVCLVSCGEVTQSPELVAKQNAEAAAQEVLNKLVWDAEDRTAIVERVSLATSNKNYPNVSISWASSEPDVISETGKVTRPRFDDERAYVDGENNVVKVVLTATVVATYNENTTDPISKQFEFTVQTLPEGLDSGSIKDVKARAWTYVYETNCVKKTLATNNEFVYQVQLTGVVTAKLNADTRGFMIHDGSDGIYVYATNEGIEVGDTVTVTGGVYTYYGSLQVGTKDTSWEKIDPVDGMTLPEYTVTTPTEWEAKVTPVDGVFADDVIGHFGGDLYKVEGLLVRKDAPAGSGKYCVMDPQTGEEIWIYYKSYSSEMEEELIANVDKYVRVPGVSYDRDSRINKNEILFVGGIEEATAPEITDEQQANVTLSQITLDAEYTADFELSELGVWEVVSGTGVEIVEGVAKVTRGEEDQVVVLKVTVTVGEAVVSKELTVTIKKVVKETPKHAGTKEDPYTVSDAVLVAGGLAADVPTEQVYAIGTIKEITDLSLQYGNATFVITDGVKDIIVFRAKYLNNEKFTAQDQIKVGDVVVIVGQLINFKGDTLEFNSGCYIDSFSDEPVVDEGPLKAGQAYKLQLVQTKAGKTVYFTGAMNGYYYATSEDVNAGVDVYAEVVEGGYNLYFLDAEGAKHYMGIVASGTYVNAVFDQEKTVFVYSETLKTVTAIVNDTEYVFGTRNDNTYTTIGANKTSYDPFTATLVIVGGSENPETPHEHVYVEGKCECGETDPNYVAPEVSSTLTITFDDKVKMTSYSEEAQVWEENGIKVTNSKHESTQAVKDYANPARFYANTQLLVECEKAFTKVEFTTAGGKNFASNFTLAGATVTVNGTSCIIEFSEAVTSFTIEKIAAQIRVASIVVYTA